jgi:hypothetical protein
MAGFILAAWGCLAILALVVAFGHQRTTLATIMILGLALVFGVLAAFAALQAFWRSDDWHRERERQGRLWEERHPYITAVSILLGIGTFLWEMTNFGRKLF